MKHDEVGAGYLDNEIIFRQGDAGDALFVIQAGKVQIVKNTPRGESTLATLHKDDIFGEMALFDRLPRSARAHPLHPNS